MLCPIIFKQCDHTHFGVSKLSHFKLELSSVNGPNAYNASPKLFEDHC